MLDSQPKDAGKFGADVNEARHPGKITLVTLTITDVSGIHLRRTLSGPQRLRFAVGVALRVRVAVLRPQMRIDDVIHIDPRVGTLALQFHPTGLTRLTSLPVPPILAPPPH